MTIESRYTWEKLALELKLLRNEDFGSLISLCIGIHSVLWPKENAEASFRQVQFLGFEILKICESQTEAERWDSLRKFLFEEKGYQFTTSSRQGFAEKDVIMAHVLSERCGHPLPVVFLLLHLAHYLDLPLALLKSRHHYILKWVRSGKTIYLDLYNSGRALNDDELIQILNRSDSNLEVWNARQLISQYLDLLRQTLENHQHLTQLHVIYNLILHMDESNTAVLGQRALLRHKLGFKREAQSDLKRYFSFVERSHAPIEIQQAWAQLEISPSETPLHRQSSDILH